jgi:tetratricopeptide (TPR) repeat protein
MQGSALIWAPTHLNLAHALRKTQYAPYATKSLQRPRADLNTLPFYCSRYEEALESYDRALQLDPICDSAFAGRGMVFQTLGRWNEAIECYHEVPCPRVFPPILAPD